MLCILVLPLYASATGCLSPLVRRGEGGGGILFTSVIDNQVCKSWADLYFYMLQPAITFEGPVFAVLIQVEKKQAVNINRDN